jgi:hypothetical protein
MVMALFAQQAAEHELIELRDLAERLELHRHDPAVAAALKHIDPQRPTKGDRALLLLVRDRLRSYIEYHRQFPFRVVPPATLQPGILLGTQRANRLPITITTEQLTRHLLLAAGTGFGKRHSFVRCCGNSRSLALNDSRSTEKTTRAATPSMIRNASSSTVVRGTTHSTNQHSSRSPSTSRFSCSASHARSSAVNTSNRHSPKSSSKHSASK